MSTSLFPSLTTDSSWRLLGPAAAGVVGGLLALALFAVPANAQTASPTDPAPDRSTWQTHYGEQAARMLRSDTPEKRGGTLQTLIALSADAPAVDLSAAVPALFEVYEADATLEHRIMAATALRQMAEHSSAGDKIMRRLGELVADQSSQRVQRLTLLVLADYESERGRTLRVTPALYDLVVERGRA